MIGLILVGVAIFIAGKEHGKSLIVVPPPPAPEPKFFGLRQAMSAHAIVVTAEQAQTLVKFVTEVLDYENTVSTEATGQIEMMTTRMAENRASIERNLETIKNLEQTNKELAEKTGIIRKQADFTHVVGQRFGK